MIIEKLNNKSTRVVKVQKKKESTGVVEIR